jgi:hypothetical protein
MFCACPSGSVRAGHHSAWSFALRVFRISPPTSAQLTSPASRPAMEAPVGLLDLVADIGVQILGGGGSALSGVMPRKTGCQLDPKGSGISRMADPAAGQRVGPDVDHEPSSGQHGRVRGGRDQRVHRAGRQPEDRVVPEVCN